MAGFRIFFRAFIYVVLLVGTQAATIGGNTWYTGRGEEIDQSRHAQPTAITGYRNISV
jgi:hypothetical protein